MTTIERSGFYQDDLGQSFLVTQGLAGYTLVAGKQCLFRVFADVATIQETDYAFVTIGRPAPAKPVHMILSKDHLIIDPNVPSGPSCGVIVRGFAFPTSGQCSFTCALRNANGDTLRTQLIPAM